MKGNTREIRSLTSLRGLAAIYVALLHFSAMAQTLCPVVIPSLAPRGQLAVDFFFDLSGFVMGYTYYRAFAADGLKAMPPFLMKRVARIWPLHAAVILFLVLYTLVVAPSFFGGEPPAITSDAPVSDTILNLLLVQGLGFVKNFNGPTWSISTEFVAYLTFPAILAFVFARAAWIRLAAAAVPVAALWAVSYRLPHFNLGLLDYRLELLRTFAGFTLGLVAYRAYAGGQGRVLGRDPVFMAVAGAILAIMVLRLGDTFAAMLFPLAILGAAYNSGFADRVLSSRPLYFLGVVSYSIYLLHEVLGYFEVQALHAIHPGTFGPAAALGLAALGTASVVPPAWAAYHLIERPGRDAMRALATRLSRFSGTLARPRTEADPAVQPVELRIASDPE
jgi:peptidoglycan/LPS O-acetylase OafA/YrhL